jgi:DNA-binding LacI/PurR family transcriptional regulator
LSYIDLDFKAAVMAAIDHLVALGHCQIGFISIAPRLRQKKYTPTIRASAGYEEACHKYGLPKLFREANLVMQDIETATLSLLDEQPQITALVTANDVAAVAVLRAIHTLNLRIPEDISVVGLATDQIAQLITPPLTAINFPSRLMGYEAGKMLISRLEDVTDEIEQVFVPIELIVRSSTGPARSRV